MEDNSLMVWLSVPRLHFLRAVGDDVVEDDMDFGVRLLFLNSETILPLHCSRIRPKGL